MIRFKSLLRSRIGLVLILSVILIAISTFTRILFLIKSFTEADFTLINLLGILFLGLLYDMANAVYVSLPLVLYLWLMPERLYRRPGHQIVLWGVFFIFSFLLLFNGVAEWFFWDEFNTRFNFIAVDYLVYTTEVVGNIQESYPVGWIIIITTIIAGGILFWVRPWIQQSLEISISFKQRSKYLLMYIVIFFITFFGVSSKYHAFSKNSYINEIAGNGLYELFAAYLNNALDYESFYAVLQEDEAFKEIHYALKTPNAEFITSDEGDIARKIHSERPERKLNIILISVESLSAEFMELFGNTESITPFLDSLANESLTFTNLYATGTRTVRGLEALSLCVPPTPGQSIVRRPDNESLFSLGKVFNEKGYQSKFFYGGYGYFDNMNYFFDNNGYTVIDRTNLKDNEIDYENIWGVADENLFELAMREIDQSINGKPVFAHIMTTSNHRPYTYPEGRIDIPSHTSRQGAVKYTDYAIGKFIKDATKKSWFDSTIFIIVADHCASSAGKTELPVEKYHIPMLIYSPLNIEAGTMDRLMSQIDIGPTLLGLLNFSYTSKFFGYDMFQLEAGRERAFISTYQKLGFLKNDELVILSPKHEVEFFRLSDDQEPVKIKPEEKVVNEAISWYQTASYSFKHGLMK